MVDKRDDGTNECRMRMVVNYKEFNKLTVVPDFPMPLIKTLIEMLGNARYLPTFNLEAEFHQIPVASEDR